MLIANFTLNKTSFLRLLSSYAFRFFMAGILALLFSSLLQGPAITNYTSAIKKFETVLHKKEVQLTNEVNLLSARAETKSYAELFTDKPDYYNKLFSDLGFVLLIYDNDTLKFWSDNSPSVENQMKTVCLDDRLVKLRNGWFEVIRSEPCAGPKKCIGLLLIKNDYPYQNNYLLNEFQKQFSLPEDVRVLHGAASDPLSVRDGAGNYLCTLKFNFNNEEADGLHIWSALLAVVGLIFLVLGIYYLTETPVFSGINTHYKFIIFILSLGLLRFITIRFHVPASLYSTPLFGPQYYGDATSFWLPSLGDMLLNTLFILTAGFYFNLSSINVFETIFLRNKFISSLLLLFTLFCGSLAINKFFISLIENSNIPFNINNVFSLNAISYMGFSIIALLLLSFFLIANWTIKAIGHLGLSSKSFLKIFLIAASLFATLSHVIGYVDWMFISMPLVVTLTIYLLNNKASKGYSFPDIVLVVFLFSIYGVHTFVKEGNGKEHHSRIAIAEKIAADKDPLTEHLFTEVEAKISMDTILSGYISSPVKNINAFEKRLRQDYFSGYWDKYDIKFTVFDTACRVLLKPAGSTIDNNNYYDEIVLRDGQETTCEHFYFLKNNSGKISYMAKLPIITGRNDHKLATIYAELDTRFLPEEIGFPELLLDRNMGIDRDLFNYSYAKYRHNELISQYGKFQFSLNPQQFINNTDEIIFKDVDGYDHLSFSPNKSTVVVISKPSYTLLDTVTYFSYLFSFFSLIVLVVIIVRQLVRGNLFSHNSFKYRIQFLLVLIVLVSLALFGTGTIFYIKQQYESKNKESISEKINSVAVELESKLGNETALNVGFKEYTNYLLKKLSSVFFTDVNVYDLKGNVYASSQPKIFDEGLASTKMDPNAYLQMAILEKTQYIHDEKIGKLEYLSAYVPFKGKNGDLIAYLNLPYFAKQTELEKEIAGFLVALINIYVLLFALSVVMAIFISNYVTRPLKLIQDKLSKIQLGKMNEPIEWKEKDEIGSLVKEYNRMIMELTKSAQLLARSERESAWREMAKQVAHEIKNPLTPMKLSVQHLQRMWNDKSPDMGQKLDRITTTLIEQIDTLSSIASAFSSFAKMPKPNNERIDLSRILQNTISLFKETEGSTIQFESNLAEEAWVFADKEQLIRVFNNLIKNALQAIPENQEGRIIVSLKQEDDQYIAMVKDNGIGISEDFMDKIFTPNFTTKSTGMGLGLAMAKNIVESCGGKIEFKTEEGRGAEFYVSIPVFN